MKGRPFKPRPRYSAAPRAAYKRAWYRKNYLRLRTIQRAQRYGLSVDELEALFRRADGKCEACGDAVSAAMSCVDHDHATGEVRGILCPACNVLEGFMCKQVRRAEAVVAYLSSFEATR